VKPIIVYFIQQNLLTKVAGGRHPQSYYAVRDAVGAVDKALADNPVWLLCSRDAARNSKDKGGVNEGEPLAKKPRL
jgi:hypothetical protein